MIVTYVIIAVALIGLGLGYCLRVRAKRLSAKQIYAAQFAAEYEKQRKLHEQFLKTDKE
jgi:hypothetical protein